MTIQPPLSAGNGLSETAPPPDGRPLLAVSSYADAVAAVDALADARFPVQHVAIVGRGVRTVEDVTGRYGPARAIGTAALSGGLIGVFFGLLFDWWGALTPEVGWGWLALYGLLYGAFAGFVVALLFERAGRRRDFSSVRTLDADHYDVTLTGGERAEALRILHDAGLV
jgi:heat induced stress protein YflT